MHQPSLPTLAIITKGYPRLSETFIAQELAALQKQGANFIIYSLRQPQDTITHPIHKKITAQTIYLPEYATRQPLRILRALGKQITNKNFYQLLPLWLWDFLRNPTPNRIRRLAQAIVLASEMPPSVQFMYFHFIHTPASVTRYAAKLRNLPYSGSAHAKDIWTSAKWDIKDKLQDAQWCVTCTKAGRDYLQSLNKTAKVHLVYHGLDPTEFPTLPPSPPSLKKQKPKTQKIIPKNQKIISVGRLVEKKGYSHVLRSLALLPQKHWQFIHIGGGEQKPYKQLADDLGVGDKVTFMGACDRPQVIALLSSADVFVLGNIVMADGDRDGIPNVLMEALWMGVPVLAGDSPSVRELIYDGKSGLLWDASDEPGFAARLSELLQSGTLRQELSMDGRQSMQERFLFADNFCHLRDLFPNDLFNKA